MKDKWYILVINKSKFIHYFCLLLIFSGYVVYLNYVGENIVYMDQIRFVNQFIEPLFNNSLTLSDLWYVKSGHRTFGYNLLFVANAWFFNLNTMLEANIAAVLLLIFALILTKIYFDRYHKVNVFHFFIYLTAILVIFGLGKWAIILLSMGIQHSIHFIIVLLVSILFDRIYIKNDQNIIYKILILVLSVVHLIFLSLSYSISLYFILSLVVLAKTIYYFIKEKKVNYFNILYLICVLSAASLTLFDLVSGSESVVNRFNFLNIVIFFFNGLASFLISENFAKTFLDSNIIFLIGIINAAIITYSIYIYFITKLYKQTVFPIFFICFSLGNLLLITIGRHNLGPTAGMASRYGGMYMIAVLGVIFILLSYMNKINKNRSKLLIIIIVYIFMCTTLTTGYEIINSKYRANYFDKRVELALKQKIDETNYNMFQDTNAEYVASAFKILQKYNLNVYYTYSDYSLGQDEDENIITFLDLKNKIGIDIGNILEGGYVVNTNQNGIPQVWVRKNARVKLSYNEGYSVIKVKGFIPFSMHSYNNQEIERFDIEFFINGKKVDQISVTQDVRFDRSIEIPQDITADHGYYELVLKANKEFNPYKLGINNDKRDLSYIIEEIIIE